MLSYSNNLGDKIQKPPHMKSLPVFCFWSDLLGFGEIFFERQWLLTDADKLLIYERLQKAHTIFLKNSMAFQETSLVLNDGLVKIHEYKGFHESFSFSMYLRSCIYTHNQIKERELKNGLPGPRSVFSYGESINYLAENIYLDDYVLNYTKPQGQSLSNVANATGNPIVVYNPSPFQMNTAFSKSYILESLGKKYGIEGSHIYIDDSVIAFTKDFSLQHEKKLIYTENNGIITIIVENKNGFPYWGFKLEAGKKVEFKGWLTTIYKMISFFPADEKYLDFELPVL